MTDKKIGVHDPVVSPAHFAEVEGALASNWLSGRGAKVLEFEKLIHDYFGVPALVTVNGSSALLLGLRALGVKAGDHVLVSAYGFVATANAVAHLGARPVFLGPDRPGFPVFGAKSLQQWLADHLDSQNQLKSTGGPVRGILYNEPYGLAAPDLAECVELARARGLFFMEDSSQAFGVEVGGRKLATFGDAAGISLNGNKTLTTGAGGILLMRDPKELDRARHLHSQARSDGFDFLYDECGYNFQMSNVLAALGCAEMKRVEATLAAKRGLRAEYKKLLTGTSWRLLEAAEAEPIPAWLNVALAPRPLARESWKRLAADMQESGVQVRPCFPAVTSYPMYRETAQMACEHSDWLFHHGLCLPSGAGLGASDVHRVVGALLEASRRLSLT